MPRVKCEFCNVRVLANQLSLHRKRCLPARRAAAKQIGFVKIKDPSELTPPTDEETVILESDVVVEEEVQKEIAPEPTDEETAGKSKKKKK